MIPTVCVSETNLNSQRNVQRLGIYTWKMKTTAIHQHNNPPNDLTVIRTPEKDVGGNESKKELNEYGWYTSFAITAIT